MALLARRRARSMAAAKVRRKIIGGAVVETRTKMGEGDGGLNKRVRIVEIYLDTPLSSAPARESTFIYGLQKFICMLLTSNNEPSF